MTRITLLSALMVAAAGSASANVLINPGFESPVVPGQTLNGWALISEAIRWDCVTAHAGSCSIALATDPVPRLPDIAYQFFDTTVGDSYDVSFYYETNPLVLRQFPDAFVKGTVEVIDGDLGTGQTLLSATVIGGATWSRFDASFIATGASSRISFKGLGFAYPSGFGGNYFNVDDVSVSASPVPEPGRWALLLAGTGVVALAGRRRAVVSGPAIW